MVDKEQVIIDVQAQDNASSKLNSIGQSITKLVNLSSSITALGASFLTLTNITDSVQKKQLALEKSTVSLKMLYTDLAIAMKKYGQDSIQVQEIQEKIRLKQEQIEQQTNDLKQAQQQLSLTYISTSASMVTALTSLGSGFSGLAGVIGNVNKMAMLTFVSSPWGLAISGIATAIGVLVFNVGGLRDALFETLKQFYEWLKTLPILGFWLESIEKLISALSKALNLQSPEVKMPTFEEVQSELGSKIDALVKSKAKTKSSTSEEDSDLESSLLDELESEIEDTSEVKPKKARQARSILSLSKHKDIIIPGLKYLQDIKDQLDYIGDRKFVFQEELFWARVRNAEEEREKMRRVISFEDLIKNLPPGLFRPGSQLSLTREGLLSISWKSSPEEIKAGLPERQTILRPIEEIFNLIDENLPYKLYQREQQFKNAQNLLKSMPPGLFREGSDIQVTKEGQIIISWNSSPEEIKAGVPARMSIGRSIDELLRFPSKLFSDQQKLAQNQDKNTQATVNALNANTNAIKELSQILKGGAGARTTKGQLLTVGGIDPNTGQKIIGMETYENKRTGESKVTIRTQGGNTFTYVKNRNL
jgi:hypothetical protein